MKLTYDDGSTGEDALFDRTEDCQRAVVAAHLGLCVEHPDTWPRATIHRLLAIRKLKGERRFNEEIAAMMMPPGDGAALQSAAHPSIAPDAIEETTIEIPSWVMVQRLAQHLHEVANHEEDRLLSYLANGIATHADHMRKKAGAPEQRGLRILKIEPGQ